MTSSAYNLTVDKMPVGKLFMKHTTNKGARTVPSGAPDVTLITSLCSPLTRTRCCLPVRKPFNHSKVLPWISY